MLRAETNVRCNNLYMGLSNGAIIDFMLSQGFNIDERIINNPFFRYKLFDIFATLQSEYVTIEGFKVNGNVLEILTNSGIYELFVNSSNGISVVHEFSDASHNDLYSSSKYMTELIPTETGFTIYDINSTTIGSMYEDTFAVRKNISSRKVNENGIVKEKEEYFIDEMKKDLIFCYKHEIESMRESEYKALFKRLNDSGIDYFKYVRKGMTKIDVFHKNIKGIVKDTIVPNIHVLSSLIDIDGHNMMGDLPSSYDVALSLSAIKEVDKDTANLLRGISKEIRKLITINEGFDYTYYDDLSMVEEMFAISSKKVLE